MPEQLRLSELCLLIDDALRMAFNERAWWVLAEINERNDSGGRIYFELVEKSGSDQKVVAKMRGSVWRQEALAAFRNFEDLTGKRPEKGMQVLVKAGVNYSAAHGLSLSLLDIDSQHMLGQLELQRRKSIELLASKPGIRLVDGVLHTPNKALAFAPVIQRIAIITSASAAGYQDFLHSLEQNPFGYHFSTTPYFSILQGEKAAAQMKEQLLKIFADTQAGAQFDAVVVIRGGGAQSDLLPFDDPGFAHAVARFPCPVITGIGHQRNESIVDMVAHTATKTPTKAAELIISHNRAFEEKLFGMRELITLRTNNLLSKQHRRIDHIGAILTGGTLQLLNTSAGQLDRVRERITGGALKLAAAGQQHLGETQRNFSTLAGRYFERQSNRLDLISEKLKHVNPESVLKRGYAMIVKNETPVVSAEQLKAGEEVKIVMRDGTRDATINQ